MQKLGTGHNEEERIGQNQGASMVNMRQGIRACATYKWVIIVNTGDNNANKN